MPDPRLRPRSGTASGSPTAHSVSMTGSGETIITSSPIVFTIIASGGSVASTVSTKRSIEVERLLVPLLLRVAGEAA